MNLLDETFIVDGCIYPVNDFNGVAIQLRRSGNVFFLTVPKSQNGFREAILSRNK